VVEEPAAVSTVKKSEDAILFGVFGDDSLRAINCKED
jgi:hypothetical protein